MTQKLLRLLRYDLPLHFVLFLTNWLPDNVVFLRLRGSLARPFLGKCGKDLRLGRNITFYNPSNISIGNHVYIAYGCWFMAAETIAVKDEVLFGPYCVIVTANHTRHNGSFRYGLPNRKPIFIDSGSWLASHVVITAGAKVGQGTLIAAQAVVVGEIPDNVMAAGQPAKAVKNYDA